MEPHSASRAAFAVGFKGRGICCTKAPARAEKAFITHGIDLNRLTLIGPQSDEFAYLAIANQIDIALDTFPYHGTKTTCDMLWMGVPVITLAGQTHVSRVGVSLLTSVGMGELICADIEKYIERAVDLANDLDRLIILRSNLRVAMQHSALMNAIEFTRDVEAAFSEMWRQRAAGIVDLTASE